MRPILSFLGKYATLNVSKNTDFGAYLFDGADDPHAVPDTSYEVLLPKNQIDIPLHTGDEISVFIYKDSEDRLIATKETPFVTLGEVAMLKVRDVTNIGAFLDWGLAKDLFLPFKEQTKRVRKGDVIPTALYIDKSDRLCATMHIYDYLSTKSPYVKGDHVHGIVYQDIENFGLYVAVDEKYSAMIPRNEVIRKLTIGDNILARVKEVKDDGKLTLTLQEKKNTQMSIDADKIITRLDDSGGTLPFHDKTSPEIITREFDMSKAAFKRALGRLKKQGLIDIYDDHIKKRDP